MLRIEIPGLPAPVSPLCLGGVPFGAPLPDAQTFALLDRFAELGGNFVDTARMYSDWIPGERGRSERVLGDWLRARNNREAIVVATKGAHPDLDRHDVPRCNPADIRADLEASLRTLQIETIDLYWLHRDDPTQPVETLIDLLNGFMRAGKIRAFGASNWSVPRLRAAQDYARRSGQAGFTANQPFWCLGCRQSRPPGYSGWVKVDAAMHAFHLETGLPVIPYTAQAKGFFTKAALPPEKRPADFDQHEFNTPPNLALASIVAELAHRHHVTPNAIVLSYLWSRPFAVVPIIGASSPRQLDDNFAAVGFRLPVEDLQRLERHSASGL